MLQAEPGCERCVFSRGRLPPLIASQDYGPQARRIFSWPCAGPPERNSRGCAALSKSLDYHRQALVKDKLLCYYFGAWRLTAATTVKERWR